LDFTVEAAFWQTWWFYGAAGVAIVLAARALYLLRMRHLTSRLNARFEERLAERTRIAQELHDTLLQGFLSASMQVHVVADRLPPESPVRPALTRAMELMTQVIDEGRNAVRGLRSTRSASLDLEEAFARIQDELPLEDQAKDPVDFRVIAEGSYRAPLHPIVRDEVFRIGREALRNAFRHSKARTIEIELNYSPSQLRMLVRDDGCGIDAETLQTGRDGHYGLAGMRERAERIGGQLRLFSNLDAGTEVELTVPGHAAFETKRKTKDETIKWTGNRR
jgi:signal transduction histidine kinase